MGKESYRSGKFGNGAELGESLAEQHGSALIFTILSQVQPSHDVGLKSHGY